jgi:hypothetical protein
MSVTELCQNLCSRWQELTQYFWPLTPQQRTQQLLASLGQQLHIQFRGLVARQQRMQQLRHRLQQAEQRLADLLVGSQSPADYEQWRRTAALQRKVSRLREILARHERDYARRCRAYERCRYLHRAIQRGRVEVVEEPPAAQ